MPDAAGRTRRGFSMLESVYGGREAGQQHSARVFGGGIDDSFLPQSERMQELTNGVSSIVIGPCQCGSSLSTMLQQAKCSLPKNRARPVKSLNRDSLLATAPVTGPSTCCTPLRELCALSTGFAELLSALVAEKPMTFWPNAVADPKVHSPRALTRGAQVYLGCGD